MPEHDRYFDQFCTRCRSISTMAIIKIARIASGAVFRRAKVTRQHELFGVNKGSARVAEGYDLTAPADPDWGRF